VALFSRLRKSIEATKESYEAGAAKAACLLLAGAFALAAVVVWFVQLFGPVTACLFFSGAFILIGLSVGSVSRAKEKEASASLESAKRGVTQNVHAVTNAVQSATSEAREHVSPLPVLILMALLLSLFYLSGSRQSSFT
jgi:Flp pilus assembly protein TadB